MAFVGLAKCVFDAKRGGGGGGRPSVSLWLRLMFVFVGGSFLFVNFNFEGKGRKFLVTMSENQMSNFQQCKNFSNFK